MTATHSGAAAPASSGIARFALIAGIIGAVLLALFLFTELGVAVIIGAVVFGLLGIGFGIAALAKRQPKGMAVTGVILGILVTLVSAGLFVFALLFIGALMGSGM